MIKVSRCRLQCIFSLPRQIYPSVDLIFPSFIDTFHQGLITHAIYTHLITKRAEPQSLSTPVRCIVNFSFNRFPTKIGIVQLTFRKFRDPTSSRIISHSMIARHKCLLRLVQHLFQHRPLVLIALFMQSVLGFLVRGFVIHQCFSTLQLTADSPGSLFGEYGSVSDN
jgi:hypothetical protein